MKKNTTQPKYFLFDAKGQILGRMATQIAKVLSGKNEVDFTPNIGGKDWVIVINSDNVRLSGEKSKKKIYYRHSGYPGGIYSATFEEMMEKDSRNVIFKAVEGMLPKNKLSSQAMTRLRVHKGAEHAYEGKITDIFNNVK
jgi:large subunit ribosomal protein L13